MPRRHFKNTLKLFASLFCDITGPSRPVGRESSAGRMSRSVMLSPCYAPSQVLVELDSALLDDQPHWYKLQLHDVSSLPLPNASPYVQRRVLQPEDTLSSRRLQSKTRTYRHAHYCLLYL